MVSWGSKIEIASMLGLADMGETWDPMYSGP